MRTPTVTRVAAETVVSTAGLGIRGRSDSSLGSVVGENERLSEQIKTAVVNRVRFAVFPAKGTNGCFLKSQHQKQTVNFHFGSRIVNHAVSVRHTDRSKCSR